MTNTAPVATDTDTATVAGSTGNAAFQFTITGDNGDTMITQVNSTPAATLAVAQTSALTQPLQVSTVEGSLPTIFSHSYWTLEPTLRDGNVILTLDYDPRDQKELNGRINFWVIDEDGLRRILAGSRPDDLALAAGSEVLFGPDKGKLQGAFRASGRGAYAVIVYNDSVVPATYQLRADGGNLIVPPPDSKIVEALP
ncbi:MAG: hypothetical protein IPK16_31625 [Anaerolineales bacterium]|nr:hypothetical protein [Anaerolineales bacterium]